MKEMSLKSSLILSNWGGAENAPHKHCFRVVGFVILHYSGCVLLELRTPSCPQLNFGSQKLIKTCYS